jgi:hypothetical protein
LERGHVATHANAHRSDPLVIAATSGIPGAIGGAYYGPMVHASL